MMGKCGDTKHEPVLRQRTKNHWSNTPATPWLLQLLRMRRPSCPHRGYRGSAGSPRAPASAGPTSLEADLASDSSQRFAQRLRQTPRAGLWPLASCRDARMRHAASHAQRNALGALDLLASHDASRARLDSTALRSSAECRGLRRLSDPARARAASTRGAMPRCIVACVLSPIGSAGGARVSWAGHAPRLSSPTPRAPPSAPLGSRRHLGTGSPAASNHDATPLAVAQCPSHREAKPRAGDAPEDPHEAESECAHGHFER